MSIDPVTGVITGMPTAQDSMPLAFVFRSIETACCSAPRCRTSFNVPCATPTSNRLQSRCPHNCALGKPSPSTTTRSTARVTNGTLGYECHDRRQHRIRTHLHLAGTRRLLRGESRCPAPTRRRRCIKFGSRWNPPSWWMGSTATTTWRCLTLPWKATSMGTPPCCGILERAP